MEFEKCYLYQPDSERPAKRRKTEQKGLQSSWPLRKKAFSAAWRPTRERIDGKLRIINATTITQISEFLDEAAHVPLPERIPSGLILAGPNSALRCTIAAQVSTQSAASKPRQFLSISSSCGTSLKSLLKTINQRATSQVREDDEDEVDEPGTSRKGPRLLNYDLQILYDHVKERRLRQVILAFEDTEAFDSDLLSELIELLACWLDRIPFVFLLNVATSVEFLQQRLSKAAVKGLDGRLFDAAVSSDEVEQVFDAITDVKSPLWIGPNLASMVLERQSDYIQSVDSLRDATQYAYMCHYYANALSIFLDPSLIMKAVPQDHLEALRNLPSFRSHAERLLDSGETDRLRVLLDDDQALFDFTKQSVAEGKAAITDMLTAADIILKAQAHVPYTQASAKSSVYIQAMSGKLAGSTMIRSLLLSIKKAPSDIILKVLSSLQSIRDSDQTLSQVSSIEQELSRLVISQSDSTQPLRSEEDVKNSTLRTTVIAQKVSLSKQKSTLSAQDTAYTALVRRLAETLESYFTDRLINPKSLPLHEIFIYDSRSPHREVFTPRPRHAIERALAAPHDYLDCDCCGGQDAEEEATLTSSQPATAILYQLYLESGSLINASDLWQAFQAVIGESEEDEERQMALFQRGLAELRYLGFLKSTRKRVDHVAKVAWRGL